MEQNGSDDAPEVRLSRERRGELDDAFEVLSDEYARYSLSYLSQTPTTTMPELADFVAGVEAAVTGTIATPADRGRVRTRLVHAVLPKLDDVDYVDVDADDRTIIRTNVPPVVDDLLAVDA